MRCVVCREGETRPGYSTVTLEREFTTLVVKQVPAQICENCGEVYMDEETTRALLTMVKHAVQNGVQVEVREYTSLDMAPA